MSSRVLIITRHYLDENNGGSNGSKAYIRALSEIYNGCTLIYPEHNDKSSEKYIPEGCNAIPCYDYRNKVQKGLDVYRGRIHRFSSFVAKHLESNEYDLVIIDHSHTANGVVEKVKKKGSKIMTIHHNVESLYLLDNKPSLLYRWPFIYYSEKAERDALLLSDLNVTVTENDAQTFREWYPNRDIHCHNMGTYQWQNLPKTIEDDGVRQCRTFAITGSLNFLQSQKPVIEFIEKFYPILLRKVPKVKLIVAGRDPSQSVVDACNRYWNIELIPNPEDIGAVIRQADIYICPINTGSGVKLRVMDGLKLGIPVLGHSIAANGYETIKDDGYFFEYYDEDSFEKSLDTVSELKYKRQDVYDSFFRYFSFQAGKERLRVILKKEKLI